MSISGEFLAWSIGESMRVQQAQDGLQAMLLGYYEDFTDAVELDGQTYNAFCLMSGSVSVLSRTSQFGHVRTAAFVHPVLSPPDEKKQTGSASGDQPFALTRPLPVPNPASLYQRYTSSEGHRVIV